MAFLLSHCHATTSVGREGVPDSGPGGQTKSRMGRRLQYEEEEVLEGWNVVRPAGSLRRWWLLLQTAAVTRWSSRIGRVCFDICITWVSDYHESCALIPMQRRSSIAPPTHWCWVDWEETMCATEKPRSGCRRTVQRTKVVMCNGRRWIQVQVLSCRLEPKHQWIISHGHEMYSAGRVVVGVVVHMS